MIAFLAYALQITLKTRLRQSATGLTPRSALEKFATVQMLDMHLPTTDGREIILTRHTHPEKELQLLLDQLHLTLPEQPPPASTPPNSTAPWRETPGFVVKTFRPNRAPPQRTPPSFCLQSAKSD